MCKLPIAAFALLLAGMVFIVSGCASADEERTLNKTLKNLYRKNQFTECIREAEKFIAGHQAAMLQEKRLQELAGVYETLADCYAVEGDAEESAKALGRLLAAAGDGMPSEQSAGIALKTGNIYRGAGLYSKALYQYQDVVRQYADEFPDRFGKYARENMNGILKEQVALISGRVSSDSPAGPGGVSVKVFNGFEEAETRTNEQGEFLIPLFASTIQTQFILSVSARGYYPFIAGLFFNGSARIETEEIRLKKIDGNDSVAAGMLYVPISGGKRNLRHGIAGFRKGQVTFQKMNNGRMSDPAGKSIVFSTNPMGTYQAVLSPGIYRMENKVLKLDKGDVKVFHLYMTM
ncbi:MAG: carboxypeptidase-like regulatory domain-containing protein [Desulfobacterales bacterium]|nr:carboxypeptidase-like regulatory domain-containing protein [Desulfobacterales bacterium]